MSNPRLEIIVGAEVNDAVRGLGSVESRMRTTLAAGQSFGKGIETSAVKASQALSKLPKFSNDATQSLVNLSRVAQDAPYGFIGIANNLNPLIESFQRLKVSTGSTGGALKALGKELTGAGGLGLAIGVISSLLVVFGDELFGTKKAIDENAKTVEKVITGYERYQQALQDVINSTVREGVNFQILSDSLSDVNLGVQKRKQVIDELSSSYSGYLSNLDQEKRSYDAINDSLNTSILVLARNAEVKALLPEIDRFLSAAVSAQVELNKLYREKPAKPGENAPFLLSEEDYKAEEARLKNIIQRNYNEISRAKGYLKTIAGGPGNLIEILFGKSLVVPKEKIKNEVDKLIEQVNIAKLPVEVIPTVKNTVGAEFEAEVERLAKLFEGRLQQRTDALGGLRRRSTPFVDGKGNEMAKDFVLAKQKAAELSEEVGERLTPLVSSLFDVFTGQGSIKSFFDSLLGIIKQVAVELGVAALKALIFKTLLSGISPAGPGAAAFGKGLLSGVFGGTANTGGLRGISGGALAVNVQGSSRISGGDIVIAFNQGSASFGRSF